MKNIILFDGVCNLCSFSVNFIIKHDKKGYIYSDAVLRIAKALDDWYRYLYIFRLMPKLFRDAIYRVVAKYRYRVFGKKESCMMPTEELLDRFL